MAGGAMAPGDSSGRSAARGRRQASGDEAAAGDRSRGFRQTKVTTGATSAAFRVQIRSVFRKGVERSQTGPSQQMLRPRSAGRRRQVEGAPGMRNGIKVAGDGVTGRGDTCRRPVRDMAHFVAVALHPRWHSSPAAARPAGGWRTPPLPPGPKTTNPEHVRPDA